VRGSSTVRVGAAAVAAPTPRSRSRWRLRAAGTCLTVTGAAFLAWVTVVWLWGDPFTALYSALQQRRLADRYAQVAPARSAALSGLDLAEAARRYRLSLQPGEPFARIRVGVLGLDGIVVEGTKAAQLRMGPGRDGRSLAPGEGGLVYLAGHRTTFGAPFGELDRLQPGDRVRLELPYAVYEYAVTGSRVVRASDVGVLRSRGREELALQACHPRFFASHRLVVYARPTLVTRSAPTKPARVASGSSISRERRRSG
jgi:sortase A